MNPPVNPFVSRRALFGAAAATLAAPAVRAQSPGDGSRTLRIAASAPPANLDPQYYTLTPSNTVAAHMFETLVYRDPATRMRPGLAQSWRLLDDETWEFTLREGVRFHDGTPLGPEDVQATLARIPVVPSPGSFAVYTRGIRALEPTGPLTFRIRTDGPWPLLPSNLSQFFVIPRSLRPDTPSADFNGGRAAIGTGPFRLLSYKPGDELLLARNPTWWGPPPVWDRVRYRIVSNPAARVAALLSGDVDLIDNVPTTDAARLRTDPHVSISECPSLRLIYIGLDTFRDTPLPDVSGPNGEPLDRNPFRDRRVREALSLAINRAAIVERTMEGAATAAGQFMPQNTFGYCPDLLPPPFDPVRARALLAEAGFPGGFRVVLHGPNDRYVNDAAIMQAVAQAWTRIGVRTEVDASPMVSVVPRLSRFECSAFLLGWSNPSGEPSSALRGIVGSRHPAQGTGLSNYGRYSNPAVDALTAKAMNTLDDGAREALMQDAMRLAMRDTGIIPLHLQKNVWATRPGLSYEPRLDEQTLAMGTRPV